MNVFRRNCIMWTDMGRRRHLRRLRSRLLCLWAINNVLGVGWVILMTPVILTACIVAVFGIVTALLEYMSARLDSLQGWLFKAYESAPGIRQADAFLSRRKERSLRFFGNAGRWRQWDDATSGDRGGRIP